MSRFSFKKSDRLTHRREFLNLSRYGKKYRNKHFIAVYRPNQSNRTRLGLTVPKKVGSAPIRNRIKRFAREYFRLHKHTIKGTWDVNLIAGKEAAGLSSDGAFQSLEAVFHNLSR